MEYLNKHHLEMIKSSKRIFKSKYSNVKPFICDYTLESIYDLNNGQELLIYFNEFGFLRKVLIIGVLKND